MSKKRYIHRLQVALTEGFLRLFGHLPLGWHRRCARFFSWIIRSVAHYRTQVVSTNLARSFPEKTYDELQDIQKQFYRYFATVFTEMVWFSACRGAKGRERLHRSHIVEFTNPEELNRLYGASRQLMLLQGHCSNWELVGGVCYYSYGTPLDIFPEILCVAHHGIASSVWSDVMEHVRLSPVCDKHITGYVPTDGVLRYALSHKEDKICYFFMTDQYPYMGNGTMDVEFMHQPTRSMSGGAALARKLDMAMGYLRYRCRPDGGYTMTVVPLCEHAAQEDPQALIRRYYELLEEDLREQPWNYLWTHKRWKKQ